MVLQVAEPKCHTSVRLPLVQAPHPVPGLRLTSQTSHSRDWWCLFIGPLGLSHLQEGNMSSLRMQTCQPAPHPSIHRSVGA